MPLFPSYNDNSGSNDDNNDSKDSDGSNSHRSKVHRHNGGNQCRNNVRSEVWQYSLKEKKQNRIHNKAEGVHIHTVHTTTVVCEEGTVNRLSNHDGDGVENVSLTVHSRSLKLHCDYSKSITLSHTQDNFNSLR